MKIPSMIAKQAQLSYWYTDDRSETIEIGQRVRVRDGARN